MKIALVGNQNSGKTTLFNYLTGMNAKIGNWPGVTIEKKEGIIKGTSFEIIDLPGIYSLMPYSSEEEIASKYLIENMPDLVINIIDATCIERSLYLTMQLLELGCNVIIALNMVDMLKKKGMTIDTFGLEKEIGVKICKISAKTGEGIENLIYNIKINLKSKVKSDSKFKIKSNLNNIYIEKQFKNQDMNEYEEIASKRYEYISTIKEKYIRKKKKCCTYI